MVTFSRNSPRGSLRATAPPRRPLSPGPGDYSPKSGTQSVPHGPPNRTFGYTGHESPRSTRNGYPVGERVTAAPGQYEVGARPASASNTRFAASPTNRMRKPDHLGKTTPGPGAYDWSSSSLKTGTPSRGSFRRPPSPIGREVFSPRSSAPGPGAYNSHKQVSPRVPGAGFGQSATSTKRQAPLVKNQPGPGDYTSVKDIGTESRGVVSYAKSGVPSNVVFMGKPSIPGPNEYDIPSSARDQTTATFGRAGQQLHRTSLPKDVRLGLGPGCYNIAQNFGQPVKYGVGTPLSGVLANDVFSPRNLSPGPGEYDIPQTSPTPLPRFVKASTRRTSIINNKIPGPGEYDVTREIGAEAGGCGVAYEHSFAPARDVFTPKRLVPGPADYDIIPLTPAPLPQFSRESTRRNSLL